ncbi:SDR family oxidoreductase [Ensifer canadensis]|uniref:SDR family oxidoreductase n=1 Tax=Ensifer canadensis TaxID=555315 RepID=UPI001AED5C0E|nr:SDR family oxidoreductase [Ensifer canadensis]
MKIVVIDGSGIGCSKLVKRLQAKGHEVIAASPHSGVNTTTGEGLAEALRVAQVVIDFANAPSFEDRAVKEFFQTSGRELMTPEKAAHTRRSMNLTLVGSGPTKKAGISGGLKRWVSGLPRLLVCWLTPRKLLLSCPLSINHALTVVMSTCGRR